jgi:hypothetical protein
MPSLLKRACAYGCPNDAATCEKHGRKAKQQEWNAARGSASNLGYGARWARFRKWWMAESFAMEIPRAGLCGAKWPGARQTADSVCATNDAITLGRTLDHITQVTGPDDPTFFDPRAVQLLCSSCDAAKRQREGQRAWR